MESMESTNCNHDEISTPDSTARHDAVVLALPGPEPTGPELSPIQAVHRHADGVISFHRINADGSFENLFGIRAEHLQEMFPEIKHDLERDSYYSVNAFWHAPSKQTRIKATDARRSDRLRYLCAVYCDIDCHKSGVKPGTALGVIINYQDDGKIPPASIIVRSGRGLWVFYVLRDSDPRYASLPQRAFPEKVIQYLAINRAAGERLVNLEADAILAGEHVARLGIDTGAHDSMRITRVPGSVNTKAREYSRVKYWVQCDDLSNPITYTLDELADAFGVTPHLDPASERAFAAAALPRGSRKRGPTAMNMRRLRDFNVLRSKRKGFAEGCRNNACLMCALLLRGSGAPRDAVLGAIEALGGECRPSLDQSAIRNAVKSVFARSDSGSYKFQRVKDQTLADLLDITPEESDLLEQLPCASRFRVLEVHVIAPLSPERRRQLIRQLIDRAGGIPTCRRMAELLAVEGHTIGRQQVLSDYRALGVETGREKHVGKLFTEELLQKESA